MKKALLFLIVLLLCIPAMAQETTAEPAAVATVEAGPVTVISGEGEGTTINVEAPEAPAPVERDPFVYGVLVVLAVLLSGAGVYGAYITGWIAKLVPPETAASIFQSGVRYGLQMALNQASRTPESADDDFFLDMAKARGLDVVKMPDGRYDVRLAKSSLSSTGSQFTSTSSNG